MTAKKTKKSATISLTSSSTFLIEDFQSDLLSSCEDHQFLVPDGVGIKELLESLANYLEVTVYSVLTNYFNAYLYDNNSITFNGTLYSETDVVKSSKKDSIKKPKIDWTK